MRATPTLERLLRRDRLVVITALLLVIIACWAYVPPARAWTCRRSKPPP